MKAFLILSIGLLCLHRADSKKPRVYKGYRSYQLLKAFNVPEDTLELLIQMVEGYNEEYDPEIPEALRVAAFWTEPLAGRDVDMMVAPKWLNKFKDHLTLLELEYKVMGRSVHNMILQQARTSKVTPRYLTKTEDHNMSWDRYCSLDDFQSYFSYLEKTYPSMFETELIGSSFEDNPMVVAKICKDGCTDSRPIMWIDAGHHADDWVGPATLMYMIRELVENSSEHPELTEKLDWYLIPTLNPDGYTYTRTNSTRRLWRKTRSMYSTSQNCIGVDAAMNYNFNWNEAGYRTNNPCENKYPGPNPFSEIEVENVATFMSQHAEQIKFASSLSSYGEMILLPWSHTNESKPEDFDKLMAAALEGSEAITKAQGHTFEVGPMIPSSGGPFDWAKGVLEVPYAYGLLLRDKERYGYLLPPEEIYRSGQEIWAFHQTLANVIIEEFTQKDTAEPEEISKTDTEPVEIAGNDIEPEENAEQDNEAESPAEVYGNVLE